MFQLNPKPLNPSHYIFTAGFFASFFTFSLQFFFPQILYFFYSDAPLVFTYSTLVFGFAFGIFIGSVFKNISFFKYFTAFSLTLVLFFFALGFSTDPSVFYFFMFASLMPLGGIIIKGLSQAHVEKFYFFDLLGGAFGVLYASAFLEEVLIETSFLLFIVLSLIIGVFEPTGNLISILKNKKHLLIPLLVLMTIVCIALGKGKINFLNLAAEIRHPFIKPDSERNGFHAIKNGAQRLYSKWSLSDRIDIIKTRNNEIWAYANNTKWTEVVKKSDTAPFKYLSPDFAWKNILSVGVGGGEDLLLKRPLQPLSLIGVDLNSGLISLLKNELADYNDNLFHHNHIVVDDARLYLETTTQPFDLIISKFPGRRGHFSNKYLAWTNWLSTQDFFFKTFDHLSEDGVAIWVVKESSSFFDHMFPRLILAANNYATKKKWNTNINSHFLLLLKKKSSTSKARTYHLLFSKKKMDPQPKWLKSSLKSFSIAYHPFIESAEKDIFLFPKTLSRLPKTKDSHEMKMFLTTSLGKSFSLDTSNSPLKISEKSKNTILINMAICFSLLILITLRFLARGPMTPSECQPTSKKFVLLLQNSITQIVRHWYLTALVIGISFGFFQAFALQLIEYHLSIVSTLYSLFLFSSLFSSACASWASKYISLQVATFSHFGLAPFIILMDLETVSSKFHEQPKIIFLILVPLVFFNSLLFPKILARSNPKNSSSGSDILISNLIGVCIGFFIFCYFFSTVGFEHSKKIGILISAGALAIALFNLFKKCPQTQAEPS